MTTFTTEERAYDVVLDRAIRRRALSIARVVDAVTTRSVTLLNARVDRHGATMRIGSGGTLAVSGRVEKLLPDPSSTTPITFTISIQARGYRPHIEPVTIAPSATLPIDLGTIALQPLPVRIEGRVTREAERTAIGRASIVARKADKIVLLRTPLQRDYSSNTPVSSLTLTASATTTTLATAVMRGSRLVMLDDVTLFAANDVVRFGEREYGVIDSITGTEVTLIDPLQHSHAAGTLVTKATVVVGTGAAVHTRRDVRAGDALLPVDTETDTTAIEIGGEYHDTGLLSDADGYFAADGIGGERSLTFITVAPPPPPPPPNTTAPLALQPLTTDVTIDYSNPVNALSLRVKRA